MLSIKRKPPTRKYVPQYHDTLQYDWVYVKNAGLTKTFSQFIPNSRYKDESFSVEIDRKFYQNPLWLL